jgi:DNA topoisomerase-6 subunit B
MAVKKAAAGQRAKSSEVSKKTMKKGSAKAKSDGKSLPKVELDTAKDVIEKVRKSSKQITTSSTAEYFAKNLQQVGFSSPTKAVLTTLKEAVDNSLDACEDAGILPDLKILVEKIGTGTLKNTDQILIRVEDNGPGIDPEDVPKVFGEYLASSKFGRGRCSRGQQGIGISAATTWAMQTTASGARVVTKKKTARKAFSCIVDMDLKNNRGIVRDKESLDWERPHGTTVEFKMDGRIQLNGEAGLLNYLRATVLVNPHMSIEYKVADLPVHSVERVTNEVPAIPDATEPHPHTMILGEFLAHARLFGRIKASSWLKKGFSRVGDKVLEELVKVHKLRPEILNQNVDTMDEETIKELYTAIQDAKLNAPSTSSVLGIGEDGLALSIQRLGDIDYFSVMSRKPTIADFKPIQVEVAIARQRVPSGDDREEPVQILRFANRVPLQFDKAACGIVKAITSVNWKSYGLKQPRSSLPVGPYIIAVSVVSPFIKFKNASKETIDGSDELVEELRRALMQAGQRLSRYLKREHKADELEQRQQHIEQFCPILVETLARVVNAPEARKIRAEEGLAKILERDTKGIRKDLNEADQRLASYLQEKKQRLAGFFADIDSEGGPERDPGDEDGEDFEDADADVDTDEAAGEAAVTKKGKKAGKAKKTTTKASAEPVKKTAKKAAKEPAAKKEAAKPAPKKTTAKKAKAKKK